MPYYDLMSESLVLVHTLTEDRLIVGLNSLLHELFISIL